MNMSLARSVAIAGSIALALVVLIVWIVPLAADTPTLTACVNPGNGNLRLVTDSAACHANETPVQWNVEGSAGPAGPVGPTGPTGPQGPAGEDGADGGAVTGPPFVWICTPAHYANVGNNSRADLYVFNASGATANVAVHILDKDGNNLAGVTVPGSSPATTYPGQTGNNTVPLLPAHTLNVSWQTPVASPDPITNVSFSVRIVSDQVGVVGSNFQIGGFVPVPCTLVHP